MQDNIMKKHRTPQEIMMADEKAINRLPIKKESFIKRIINKLWN